MKGRVKLRRVQAAMSKGRDKGALHPARAQHPGQKIGKSSAKDERSIMERTDRRRERLARKASQLVGPAARNRCRVVGYHQLTDGSPGIIADQGDFAQIEGLQKNRLRAGPHPGDSGSRPPAWAQYDRPGEDRERRSEIVRRDEG